MELAGKLAREFEGRLGQSPAAAVAQARHQAVRRLVEAAYRHEGTRVDHWRRRLGALTQKGLIDGVQTVVSLVVITLFVPCVANLLVIVKEREVRTAVAVVGFIIPFAFLVGGVLRWVLTWLGATL